MTGRRVLVVGGGIAGLAAAVQLVADGHHVELWEAEKRLGGKIATSPFAGRPNIDEGADAFLTRVPHATQLAAELGLTDLTAPTGARAAVYHDGLHDIPDGIMLGVPASVRPFITTSLLSWRGTARAATEPFRRRTDPDDSLGALIRARFGDEVHERLVDSLVGSIYATDTDRSSLASVPQLAALADRHRSLLIGARTARKLAPAAEGASIFAAPRSGMATLVQAAATHIEARGASIHVGRPVSMIEPDGDRWRVVSADELFADELFDGVIVATPAASAAGLLAAASPDAAAALGGFEHADVIMVRLSIAADDWPHRLAGRSGYLVPKPNQRFVTAASFGSQKWEHWAADDGSQVVRVSLGRDGLPVADLGDDDAIAATIDEVGQHLGIDLQPEHVDLTRWTGAFPQYRPHHDRRVDALQGLLPATLALAGASYHGIGIPACIADGRAAARRLRFKESTEHADRFLP